MKFKRNYAQECKEEFAKLQKKCEVINNYGWLKRLLFAYKKRVLVEQMEMVLKIWKHVLD